MSEQKLLQQDELEALLKSDDQNGSPDFAMGDQAADPGLALEEEDNMAAELMAAADALLLADAEKASLLEGEPKLPEEPLEPQPALEGQLEEQDQAVEITDFEETPPTEPTTADADPVEELTAAEEDALGELGSISMGAAATTLSQLLSRRVDITSPELGMTTREEFIAGFQPPFLVIQVQFKQGFTGYNILVIKMHDAKVLANLIMEGADNDPDADLTDLEISAVAEAMNQMIGTSSTALADLVSRSIMLAPPQVTVVREIENDQVNLPFADPLVVTSFDFKIKDALDTTIKQVIDLAGAHEQAQALLGNLGQLNDDADESDELENGQNHATSAPARYIPSHMVDDLTTPIPPPQMDAKAMTKVETQKLNLLLDIPLKVSVVLGRTKKSIKEVLSMTPGAISELETTVGEAVDVLVNGKLVAKGEVVVVNENFGVKITSIISATERINSLGL